MLIVFEGLDCSGKTTLIKRIIEDFNSSDYVYCKGIGSKTKLGCIARKIPSTLIFFIELLTNMIFIIKPRLKKRKTVILDRYEISISSYVPLTKRFYNKLFIKIFSKLLIKPDAVVYLILPLKERIQRLLEKGDKYELMLANNPKSIVEREKEYNQWFEVLKCPKIRIDTTGSIDYNICTIKRFILNQKVI